VIDLLLSEQIDVIKQLEILGCETIQIRVFEKQSIQKYIALLEKIQSSKFRSIQLIIPYDKTMTKWVLTSWFKNYPRLSILSLHSSYVDRVDPLDTESYILHTKRNINSEIHCGIIKPSYFTSNIPTFTESQKFNSCLNKKISIDEEGNIKNCPSMKESFGNIKDTTLQEALNKNGFKKYWNINKDKIKICQDCEFRYVCTDCRAYTEDPNDKYSKPLKCGYNPYTAEWEEWSTNPLKQKAIEYYGMQKLVKDIVKNDMDKTTKG
jgi:SPASM domain peptide maturase of grasp-with-spasm system